VCTLPSPPGLRIEPEVPPANRTAWCVDFIQRVKARTSKTCIFYSNEARVTSHNWQPVVDTGAPLWVAKYGKPFDGEPHGPQPKTGKWPMAVAWQYTSTAHLPGITALKQDGSVQTVDVNQLFGDVGLFRALGSPVRRDVGNTTGIVRDMARDKDGAVLLITGNAALLITSQAMAANHTAAGIPHDRVRRRPIFPLQEDAHRRLSRQSPASAARGLAVRGISRLTSSFCRRVAGHHRASGTHRGLST
jgi:Glycosyl hydrolases family 25